MDDPVVWEPHAADQSDSAFVIQAGPLPVADAGGLHLELLPVLPNPTSVRPRLRFTLPSAATARLVVLDVAGRTVATLIDGPQSAGVHEWVWDRRGARGEVAAGVYFARLEVGGVQRVQRFVLN